MQDSDTQLSDKDAQIFLDMLHDDSEPNEELKNAASQYMSPECGDDTG